MISLVSADGRRGKKRFYASVKRVLRPYAHARSTDDDIMHMLVEGRSEFFDHATVQPFVLTRDGDDVGHVALIHDRNLPEYVQAAFFGALPGLSGVADAIRARAKDLFPACTRWVAGLNGHLNYSAGILTHGHDYPPLFGFTWTPPYYPQYFQELTARSMVSFRFDADAFYTYLDSMSPSFDARSIRVRLMNKRKLADEIALYTDLNNACFGDHPFWSNRSRAEDFELFSPFRHLMREENLIFAEIQGEPVGFLLWYPDFQELVSRPDENLGIRHVLKYRFFNPIRTVRLAEIAVKKEHRRTMAVPAMILEMIRRVRAGGYKVCEGGFIFEENRSSLAMTLRFIERATQTKLEAFRRFCVFEGVL